MTIGNTVSLSSGAAVVDCTLKSDVDVIVEESSEIRCNVVVDSVLLLLLVVGDTVRSTLELDSIVLDSFKGLSTNEVVVRETV